MPILADYHMHTSFSLDSEAKMKDMIESALSKGLKQICITEHMDIGAPVTEEWPEHAWECNVDSYLYELIKYKNEYVDKIEINFGIELGLMQSQFRPNAIAAKSHEFDFIIGSIHFVNDLDIYWPDFFEGKTAKKAIDEYFNTLLLNVKQFNNFDVLGHLDYIVRTVPGGEASFNPMDHKNVVEEILNTVIEKEKGIELNTAQLAKDGFKQANPCIDYLKLYKELGGEIITIGSDAHVPENIAGNFNKAEALLKEAGFNHYCTFKDRVASFHKL